MRALGMSVTLLALLFNTWLYQRTASAQQQNAIWTPGSIVDATGATFRQPTATRTVYASQLAGIHLDGSLTANTGTDDRATLQAVLDTASASSPLILIIDGVAAISTVGGGLVLNSNTEIRGVGWQSGFSWLGSATANQQPPFINANPNGGTTPTDTNLVFRDFTVNGNHDAGHGGAGQLVPNAMNSAGIYMAFFRIVGATNVAFYHIKSYKSCGFAIHLANVQGFTVRDYRMEHTLHEFADDGVHINGPASNGLIQNVSGFTGDDMVALNPDDGHLATCTGIVGSAGSYGNNALPGTPKNGAITDVLVDGIVSEGSYEAFRLLSNVSAIDNVTLRNVRGTTYGHIMSPDSFPPCGWSGGGAFGNITMENIAIQSTDVQDEYGLGAVTLFAKFKSLRVSLVLEDYAPSTTAPVFLTSSLTNIEEFDLNLRSSQTAGLPASVWSMGAGTVKTFNLSGWHDANFGTTQTTVPIISCTSGTVSRLTSSLSAEYINNIITADGCTLTTLTLGNGVHNNAGAHGTVNIASGSIGTLSQGNYVTAQLKEGAGTFGPTPSVGTCGTIGTGSTNAAGFISSATSGSCVSVLTFSGAKAPTGWSCGISNATTANIITQTGSSTTTATFTGTTVSGDVLRYTCQPY